MMAGCRYARDHSLRRRRYKMRQNPWVALSRKTVRTVPEPHARLGIRPVAALAALCPGTPSREVAQWSAEEYFYEQMGLRERVAK